MENNMIGGKKLAEGGYGCVFKPEISCKGQQTKNKKHISKLQFETFSSRNENKISDKIIKEYKNYDDFFSPIISSCEIKVKNIDEMLSNECDVLKKMKTDKISISKIKYIDNVDYEKYVMKNINEKGFFYNKIIKTFYKLLQGIKLLKDIDIVHFDLKGLNIIFDDKRNKPMIIDFGLSFDVTDMLNNIDSPKYYYYFYRYVPEYYIWPLEVHFMNLLLHETETPTNENLKDLANKFVYNNSALLTFSNDFKHNYYNACYDELLTYNKLNFNEKKEKIMKSWNTWDNYSLSVMLIIYIYSFNKGDNNNNFNKITNEVLGIILFNIHPNYKNRFSVEQTIHKINSVIEINKESDNDGGIIEIPIVNDSKNIKNILDLHMEKNKNLNSSKLWYKTNLES